MPRKAQEQTRMFFRSEKRKKHRSKETSQKAQESVWRTEVRKENYETDMQEEDSKEHDRHNARAREGQRSRTRKCDSLYLHVDTCAFQNTS